jgi:sensor domain CHASE-containing protein
MFGVMIVIAILLVAILILVSMIWGRISHKQADSDPDGKIKQEIFDSLTKIKIQLEKTV